ncbi:alpha/beta fold hydrolase [Croceicoccus naphthovorans]|uniref:alpha/beta fold hydrolase n=1 Tax=Croceicoccus naphthovorans TaxID=1348774 RepID=UPI00069E28D2|nr:alpha/beta fold hydrolase [Croceicoccus naphthovorans]MBB3988680.1 pimeloyl-ACP methyl ester carboxylesterase [Croceicoccus naphthovorans]
MAFTFRTITVEGLTLRVGFKNAASQATPLLMLNGIGFNAELMEPLSRQFPGRPIVCPDMPGCGQSPDPVLPYTMSRLSRAMLALMETEFPDRPFDLLGFSWGGALAQQIATSAARRVNRMVLLAAPSGMPLPFANPEVMRRLLDPTEYVDPTLLSENFHALLQEGGAGAGLLRRFVMPSPRGVGSQVLALAGWSSAMLLPFVRMPVLLAGMAEDPIVPIAHQRALSCLIPQAETVEFRQGSHLLPLALPDKVGAQLAAFMAGDETVPA